MRSGTDAEWAAFVASSWPGLVRTATLLGGDPAAAEELATAALVRTRRQVRSRDDGTERRAAWAQLARRTLLARPATAGARLRAWIRRPGTAVAPGADPLIDRYRALRPRQRALLVLTVADGLDIAAAAGLLGLAVPRAAGDLAAALDDLRWAGPDGLRADPVVELDLGYLTPRADAGTGADADAMLARDALVQELREAFARLAAAAPAAAGADGPRRVERATVAQRRSRRHVAALSACLSLAVAATAMVVARENARIETERQRLGRERAAYAALHPQVLSGDVSAWPTRGSRATDARLLADVGARIGGRPAVLFAGDVVGVDVVVALTGPGTAPLLHVLAGSPGSALDAWREAGAGLLVGPGAVPAVSAAVADEQGRLHLLTVTLTSGITVAYSPAPLLSDDATVSRRYLRLPLTEGIGTALVTARPDRLRVRVDGAGFESIVAPLTVTPAAPAPDAEAATRAPVSTTGSCERSPELGDVQYLVREATGNAGLAGTDVTGIRMLWCRQEGSRGEAAVALTAGHGPDIQCYESVDTASDGLRTTSSQCWPVPRGTAATAPFVAPDLSFGSAPSDVLDLTVFAPGSTSADLRAGPLASPPVAAGPVAADGYVRFAVPLSERTSAEVFERAGIVVVRDRSGEARAILPLRSRHLFDVWGEGADGPVVQR